MANKYLNRASILLVEKRMKIKTLTFYCILDDQKLGTW